MKGSDILFVNHASAVSGAEMVLLDVVKGFDRPTVFLFERGALTDAMERAGAEVMTSRFGRGFGRVKRDKSLLAGLPLVGNLCGLAAELILAARRHKVIYANSQKAFTVGALAAAVTRRPLIWHLHDIVNAAHFGAGQRKLQVALANRFATKVVVPSQSVADAFVAAGGREELVTVVPNGLSVTRVEAPREELRRELGLPSGPLIGVFSRLSPWKGQHVVLRALHSLPGVHCIFAGSALFGEDEYEESLKGLAETLGLGDRVTLLGQRSDVAKLMQAVDILVHPSVDPEPFGRTLVEAMLVRTPVIATSTGAPTEILAGGEAGVLVPPGDTEALVSAISGALGSPATLVPKIEAAELRAKESYGVEAMRASISGMVQSVLAGGRA